MQQNNIEIFDEKWIPIGTSDTLFTRSYNGNGFMITELTHKIPVATLFGNINSANIYNMIVVNCKSGYPNSKAKGFVCKYEEECQIYDTFFE